jgi:hypothetical protein
MRYQREIRYNDSGDLLRLEFPSHWRAESISGVSIAITTHEGGELLASTSATIYTATTINGAVSIGATSITLAGTAGNLAAGDRIRIAGPYEDCVVKEYNSTTKVATLERALVSAHASGVSVYGLWATYNLVTTTTATWPLNTECVLLWTPAGSDDLPLTETAIVSRIGFGAQAYRERFAALYPAEFEVAELRIENIYAEAKERLRYRLLAKNLDIDRVIDQGIVMPPLLDLMRWLIVMAGGNAYETEREASWAAFLASEESLASQPIWTDDNQDLVEAEEEVNVHEPWRRARGL